MLEQRRRWAVEEGLDPEAADAVFQALVSFFVNKEMDHFRRNA